MNKLLLFFAACCISICGYSQTVALSPTGAGGFEFGSSLLVNGWTAVNSAANQWVAGTGSVYVGARGAYIGTTTSFVGTNTAAKNHFYRDVAIPATATNVKLTFKYKQPTVDPGWDSFYVSVGPNTATPVAGTTLGVAFTRLYQNTATAYASYTTIGPLDLSAFAGTTARLVFSYINDGATPIGIPAVDSVALTYCNLPAITGTAEICNGATTTFSDATTGGTWSSANPAVATVASGTGVITGVSAGTAAITYIAGTCSISRVVSIDPLPSAYTVTGGGAYCSGGSGVSIGLDASDAGFTYRLYNGATLEATLAGTGLPLDFGLFAAAGTYTVTATNTSTLCTRGMSGSATVVISPLPVIYNVTGGGSVCTASGSPGVPVSLSGSQAGVTYTLYNGSTAVATAAGTGSALDFGTFTDAGTYTASGVNTATACTSPMAGSADIVLASPVVPSVSISASAASVCSGTMVTYTATPVNGGATPAYQWYVNGVAATSTADNYTYTPVSGDVVSVTLYPVNTCVTVDSATDSTTTTVIPSLVPSLTISASPGNPSCMGRPVTFSTAPFSGGTAPSYVWNRNGINVATGPTFTCVPSNGDIFICTLTSNYICRLADDAVSNTIVMSVVAGTAAPSVAIAEHPGGIITAGQNDTLQAIVTGGTAAVSYLWHINGAPVGGATSATFVSNSLANGDIVTCQVTNTDVCANSGLGSRTVSVGALGAAALQASAGDAISVFPDPNTGTFFIKGAIQGSGEISIAVTDMLGRQVYNSRMPAGNGSIATQVVLGSVAPGLYNMSIYTAAEHKAVRFAVK